jgi:hypothetical protein
MNQALYAHINNKTKMKKKIEKKKKKFGQDDWGDPTNVQYKPNWNCHYESPCITNIS